MWLVDRAYGKVAKKKQNRIIQTVDWHGDRPRLLKKSLQSNFIPLIQATKFP